MHLLVAAVQNAAWSQGRGPAQGQWGPQQSAGLTRMLPSGRTMSQLVEP